MKLRLTLFFVCLSAFLFTISGSALAEEKTASGGAVDISAVSAVLIEGSTGDIIYEKDKDKELVPASITKIMTLTLIFEALDNGKLTLETPVSVSEYAASMGGSQVFLEPNETQTVDTMIKCISIASANDAAVAMAEKIAGSEEAFVKKMNEKAVALGMKHTQFKNCTGLDDNIESGHFSSASDIIVWFVYAQVFLVIAHASSHSKLYWSINMRINSATATVGCVSFNWKHTFS